MKKIFILILIGLTIKLNAQEPAKELNCHAKWVLKFEERGADAVVDGIYNDVIVTIRNGAGAVCYNGKAEVKNGVVIKFYTLLEDGKYEEVVKHWKPKALENVDVINGMSKSMMTMQNELVTILWPKKIKPKKSKASIAAEPTDD